MHCYTYNDMVLIKVISMFVITSVILRLSVAIQNQSEHDPGHINYTIDISTIIPPEFNLHIHIHYV